MNRSTPDGERGEKSTAVPATGEEQTPTMKARIKAEISSREVPLQATTFIQSLSGVSKAVQVEANNGKLYRVKGVRTSGGRRHERMMCNDHIAGQLGHQMGAPVPSVQLMEVPDVLVQSEPGMSHLEAGPGHSMRWVPNVSGKERNIEYCSEGDNRSRWASIALFFGWFGAERDEQFFYDTQSPRLVHSFDHGHFFPGGPKWTESDLSGADPPVPHSTVKSGCNLQARELSQVAESLAAIEDQDIARAVAEPLPAWGIDMSDRLAVASFLRARRDHLIQNFC